MFNTHKQGCLTPFEQKAESARHNQARGQGRRPAGVWNLHLQGHRLPPLRSAFKKALTGNKIL